MSLSNWSWLPVLTGPSRLHTEPWVSPEQPLSPVKGAALYQCPGSCKARQESRLDIHLLLASGSLSAHRANSSLVSWDRSTSSWVFDSPNPGGFGVGTSRVQAAQMQAGEKWTEMGLGRTGVRLGHSLGPLHLGAGDGADEGHHTSIVQQQPYQGHGCLLLLSAYLTQDVGSRRRDWLGRERVGSG